MATTTLEIIMKLIVNNGKSDLMNAIKSRRFQTDVTMSRRAKACLPESLWSAACQIP